MRRLLATAATLLALSACQPGGSGKPTVKDARVRLSAVSGSPAAAYFTLRGGDGDDRLLRIDSAVVDRIELHENIMNGGMMTMRPMAQVPLPARTTVEFAPGGNHAMLFGVDGRITPGTAIPMLFTFASGEKVEVEAKTVAAGADDMSSAHP